jgi:excisionase family DNA binding protein
MSIDFDSPVELLTIPEVADLLKISVPSVRRLQQQRRIPFFKIGGSVRFAAEAYQPKLFEKNLTAKEAERRITALKAEIELANSF